MEIAWSKFRKDLSERETLGILIMNVTVINGGIRPMKLNLEKTIFDKLNIDFNLSEKINIFGVPIVCNSSNYFEFGPQVFTSMTQGPGSIDRTTDVVWQEQCRVKRNMTAQKMLECCLLHMKLLTCTDNTKEENLK